MIDQECEHCEGKGLKAFEDICNKCGLSCMKPVSATHPKPQVFVGVQLKYDGGYDSTHADDGMSYHMTLCEKCLFEFVKTFMIPPFEEPYL